jgi:hypothetical protein
MLVCWWIVPPRRAAMSKRICPIHCDMLDMGCVPQSEMDTRIAPQASRLGGWVKALGVWLSGAKAKPAGAVGHVCRMFDKQGLVSLVRRYDSLRH